MRIGKFCQHSQQIYRFFHKHYLPSTHTCGLVRFQSTLPSVETQEEVNYPPVKPQFPPGKWDTETLPGDVVWNLHSKQEKLKNINQAKERLECISQEIIPNATLYRLPVFSKQPGTFDFKRFATKSNYVQGLPKSYDDLNVDKELEKVRPLLIESLLQEHVYQHKSPQPMGVNYERKNKLAQIVNVIQSAVTAEHKHLQRAQLDENVDVRTFWHCAGFDDHEKAPAKGKWYGRIWFDSRHNSTFQVRTEQPLPQLISLDNPLCQAPDDSFPPVDYGPQSVGCHRHQDKCITVSGHWIGDPCEFGQVSFLLVPPTYDSFCEMYTDPAHHKEMSLTAGMMASFNWCVSQAHNQGFNYLMDVTYPFSTQTVITDGSWFRFCTYQLNTLQLWQTDSSNPLHNVLWASDEMKLYDTIEDDQVTGFNDEVLRQLLRFYLLKPVDRGVDLRPYLPEEEAPANNRLFINRVGDEPLYVKKIGRWEYPKDPVYF